MPFVPTVLQTTLTALFNSMKDGDSTIFANGIASAITTFVSTGSVVTVDTGAVAGGTFAGSGSGTLVVTPTQCATTIKNACDTMKNMESGGDDFLAEKIGEGLKQMADNGTVTTVVSGVLTPPPPATPAPFAGSASGSIKCSETALVSSLKMLFREMYSKKDDEGYDGNSEFAKKLATEINTFWISGVISTDGSGNLAGVKGSGSVS